MVLKYKVKDLLYAILIKSANDASIVLAEAVSGSEKKFVQLESLLASFVLAGKGLR